MKLYYEQPKKYRQHGKIVVLVVHFGLWNSLIADIRTTREFSFIVRTTYNGTC
jgi:hypothetical protein